MQSENGLEQFFAELATAGLRVERKARSTANLTGFAHPAEGCVFPVTVGQVEVLVRCAGRHGVPLYPFSSGFNWGYGSASAVREHCVQVDLSSMKRIGLAEQAADDGIDLERPVVVLEPGVTQGELADYLATHHPELMFNVTGSARETSILGASLERAVGYFGPRRDDVFGLEVVTGTGERLRTGFRRLGDDSPIAHCHPYGLGPQLEGLFFQGNFGIVTSACFRLMPRRACHVAVSIGLKREADLPQLIDALGRLKRAGVLPAVTHIGNQARTHVTLFENISRFLREECGVAEAEVKQQATRALNSVSPHAWTGLAGVMGTRPQVAASIAEIRRVLRGIARVQVVSDGLLNFALSLKPVLKRIPFLRPQIAAVVAIKPLHGLATGVPSSVAVDNLILKYGGAVGGDVGALDASRCGLLFVSPVLPLKGSLAVAVLKELEEIAAGFGHTLYITLNIETELSQVAVINLLFDRGVAEEVERAQACADKMYELIEARGLSPYRARIDMMARLTADSRGDSTAYWRYVAELKKVFDPQNIIAPGRYSPL